MASSNGGPPPPPPDTPMAAAMDAKLMVATSHGDCQQLKDLLNKQASTSSMVMVLASGNNATVPVANNPFPVAINPLLLASACNGSPKGLDFLLDGKVADGDQRALPFKLESQRFGDLIAAYTSSSNRTLPMQPIPPHNDPEALQALTLLEGMTVDGDTALHAVASNGESDDFQSCAKKICEKGRRELLFKPNKNGDTPLHCAARAGNSQMVSHLINLARGDVGGGTTTTINGSSNNTNGSSSRNRVKELLEMENEFKETALHEAVRIGDNGMVELLMDEDPELASFPKDGTSPLFLAILLEEDTIVETLYNKSNRKLSYAGQKGQNALHAAVHRGTGLTKKIIEWNSNLTIGRDEKGSTPLHFAATKYIDVVLAQLGLMKPFAAMVLNYSRGNVCWHVMEANPAALYHADRDGLYPIHVAASVGAVGSISIFVNKSPSCAGLRDTKGRTFLHVAVQRWQIDVIRYACSNKLLSCILNMQDIDGNTALHLAVKVGSLRMFCVLFGNLQVRLNLMNKNGATPLDISWFKIPRGMYSDQNSEAKIHDSLTLAGARNGSCRLDHFKERYAQENHHDEKAESEKVKDSTQTLAIGSVLIATVTFGATFALPGGYKADDHTNGGTPTLAGRYAFDAFMMANTFAFIFAAIATIGLMYSGSPLFNSKSRKAYLLIALYCMETSVTCLITTFAVGVYMVLSPVARKTAIAICTLSPLVVLCKNQEFWIKWALLACPLYNRMGMFWAICNFVWVVVRNVLYDCWPFIFIFGWAAFAWNS
uniref:PGG domain-containing protein n=1 Tax=Leersia perrieri TaxID=77586 RepID=A0A0D9XCG5_9ORYZ